MATTALFLPGWDEQSIIGHDELTGRWFAQLWPNGSTSDHPEEWVNTQTGPTLFGLILGATGVSDVDLETALTEALRRNPQHGRRQPTSASTRQSHAHRRLGDVRYTEVS